MNQWHNRKRRSRSQRPEPERDPLDRDYGFGRTEEGRPITGIDDGALDDPNAPIDEPKGEILNIGVSDLSKLPPTPSQIPCAPGQHDLVPDPSEEEWEAETCTKCPMGRLITRK